MRDIPTQESLTIEFKSDVKRYPDKNLIEEVVGMANTQGGELYLGVEDDGIISGVHNAHRDAIGLTALIANNTVPPISVRAELVQEDGLDILAIEIPKSRSVVATSSGKILRRRLKADGTPENVPMFPHEISGRLADLRLLDISSQPLQGAVMDDLDDAQRIRLRRIIQSRQGGEKSLLELSNEELDKALHLVTDMNGVPTPTVTGMLLLGKEERIIEQMPTVGTVFQVLEGTTVRMNEAFSIPLLEVFEQLEVYMKAWNPEHEVEYGLFRLPIPEFDASAFREGIVNAFCHRDYTMLGRVRLSIDDEGLSISSPGGFIDGVSLKNLLTVEPHGRNPTLADAMKRIGLAERTGRGIDRIYEGSIIYGRPWPDYSESTSQTVRLFIPRAKPDLAFARMIADEQNRLGKALSIYTLMILSVLKHERRAGVRHIAALTGLSELKIRSVAEHLVEDGLLEASGRGNNRNYMLSKTVYRENRQEIQYVRQAGIDDVRYPEMVLKLAQVQDGFITKKDVANLLKVSGDQAYQIIKRLQEANKLRLFQSGRYAKYQLVAENEN